MTIKQDKRVDCSREVVWVKLRIDVQLLRLLKGCRRVRVVMWLHVRETRVQRRRDRELGIRKGKVDRLRRDDGGKGGKVVWRGRCHLRPVLMVLGDASNRQNGQAGHMLGRWRLGGQPLEGWYLLIWFNGEVVAA